MIDLVLVNPNNRTPAPFSAIEPPLWLGLIAGYHLGKGKTVAIVDAEAERLTAEQTATRVEFYRPRETIIVVMGANPSVSSTPKMVAAEKLLKHLPGAKLTGLHPSAVNHPKAILKPFEGFPTVPWYLLSMVQYRTHKWSWRYRAHNWHCLSDIDNRHPYAVLYTSLNCPFDCFFCNIHTLYGDREIRWRPMRDIFSELHYFTFQGIRNIKVWDELFTLNNARVNQICDFIIAEGYNFNIWAYARVGTVNEKMLKRMKQAGFNWLAYGFESAKDDLRRLSRKKFATSQMKQTIEMTRDAGINIMANFLFGLPGDGAEGMEANVDMAIQENFEYVNFNVALPYPGSEWYSSLKEKNTDWSSFNQFAPNICASPEVVKARDKAFSFYFTRPEYLSMIRKKFGEKAEQHIKEMSAWRIRG